MRDMALIHAHFWGTFPWQILKGYGYLCIHPGAAGWGSAHWKFFGTSASRSVRRAWSNSLVVAQQISVRPCNHCR